LADVSRAPLYLYDLPTLTGTKLQLATVVQLSEHPNIRGIKCSDEPSYTRRLIDHIDGRPFRVIMAQPDLIDVFFRFGIREQLDGMFALCPEWVVDLSKQVLKGDFAAAAARQRQVSALRFTLIKHGLFPAFTAAMNARGIPGNFAPMPYQALSEEQCAALLAEPVLRELLS
jgi:4-hydroxy-tetrahydrodipicolinate synthase